MAPQVSPAVGEPGALGARALAWQWAAPTLLLLGTDPARRHARLGRRGSVAGTGQGPAGGVASSLWPTWPSAWWPSCRPSRSATPPAPPVSPVPASAEGKAEPRPAVSPALFEAGQYLRVHADPRDIIATNRIWNGRTNAGYRDNRDFSVVALSGLRTDVSGYGYAPRMLQAASMDGVPYFYAPFWDPARLAVRAGPRQRPTRATLDAAYRDRGIRWIVADERSGAVSPELARLTDVVMHRDGVWLGRLRPPAT